MGCCYSNSNHFNDIDFEYGKEVAEKYKQCKKYTNTEKSDLLFNIYPSNQRAEIFNSFDFIKISSGIHKEIEPNQKRNFVKIQKIENETDKNETISFNSFLGTERKKINKLKEDTKKNETQEKRGNDIFFCRESAITAKEDANFSFFSSVKNDISKSNFNQVEKSKSGKENEQNKAQKNFKENINEIISENF